MRISAWPAVLLVLLAPAAFAGAPEIDVKAVCRARSASRPPLPDQDCVREEEVAKQQLVKLWESTPAPIRNRCEREARALGTTSYLDLVACIEITEDSRPGSRK